MYHLLVGVLVVRSVIVSCKKGVKLHFQDSLGALVLSFSLSVRLSVDYLFPRLQQSMDGGAKKSRRQQLLVLLVGISRKVSEKIRFLYKCVPQKIEGIKKQQETTPFLRGI